MECPQNKLVDKWVKNGSFIDIADTEFFNPEVLYMTRCLLFNNPEALGKLAGIVTMSEYFSPEEVTIAQEFLNKARESGDSVAFRYVYAYDPSRNITYVEDIAKMSLGDIFTRLPSDYHGVQVVTSLYEQLKEGLRVAGKYRVTGIPFVVMCKLVPEGSYIKLSNPQGTYLPTYGYVAMFQRFNGASAWTNNQLVGIPTTIEESLKQLEENFNQTLMYKNPSLYSLYTTTPISIFTTSPTGPVLACSNYQCTKFKPIEDSYSSFVAKSYRDRIYVLYNNMMTLGQQLDTGSSTTKAKNTANIIVVYTVLKEYARLLQEVSSDQPDVNTTNLNQMSDKQLVEYIDRIGLRDIKLNKEAQLLYKTTLDMSIVKGQGYTNKLVDLTNKPIEQGINALAEAQRHYTFYKTTDALNRAYGSLFNTTYTPLFTTQINEVKWVIEQQRLEILKYIPEETFNKLLSGQIFASDPAVLAGIL